MTSLISKALSFVVAILERGKSLRLYGEKKNKYISKIDIENVFLAQRIERINLNFDFGH